ncbi:MAG: sulfotransferase family 2 domain-containing protein [Chitinophagales bacterium]
MFNKIIDFFYDSKYPFYLKNREDVIFIHITKTAGTSIRHSLDFNKVRGSSYSKHYHSKEVQQLVGAEKWDNAFKFSFVRNPWDRLFSYYRFKRRKKIEQGIQVPEFSHDEFRKWSFELINHRYQNFEDRAKANFAPQKDWLINENNEVDLDFIGRFETLEEDFQKICQIIGVNEKLKHHNQSIPVYNYFDYYEKDLMDLVADFYKKDIEEFGYSFK